MLIDSSIKKNIIKVFNEIEEANDNSVKIPNYKILENYNLFLSYERNLSNKIKDYKVSNSYSSPYNKKKYDQVNLLQLVCLKNLINEHTKDFLKELFKYYE